MRRVDLIDPWGGVVAGVAGGLTWALTAPATGVAAPLGLGVAAAVYAVKLAADVLLGSRESDAPGGPDTATIPALPEPAPGSRTAGWRDRALAATESLCRLAEGHGVPLALSSVAARSRDTYADVRRLAGRIAAVEQGLAAIPTDRLRQDQARLREADRTGGSADVRAERERARVAIVEQLAAAERLHETRDRLLARLQATTLGLEGLVVRGTELRALSASAGADTSAAQVADLTAELDGLRAGIAEAEDLSRRVLDPGADQPDPG